MNDTIDKGTDWTGRYGEAHNARRRNAYQTDENYRQKMLEQARDRDRALRGVVLTTCLDKLPHLNHFGEMRDAEASGKAVHVRTYTHKELAEIIGCNMQLLYRWKAKGLLPEPVFTAQVYVETTGKGGSYFQPQAVYVLEEVQAIVEVIGQHQTQTKYYREAHTQTRDALFEAVDRARAVYGV